MSKSKKHSLIRQFPCGIFLKFILFFATTIVWAGLLVLLNSRLSLDWLEVATYSILTSVLTLWILHGMEHFESFHPIPRPDAILTLLVTVSFAAAVSKYLVLTMLGLAVLRYRDIFLCAPLVSGVFYTIQVLAGLAFIKSGARRKICLLTSSHETEQVLRAFRSKGLSKFYEPVLPSMLQKSKKREQLAWVVISRAESYRFAKHENLIDTMLSGTEIVDYRELIARLSAHLDLDSFDLWMFLLKSVRRNTLSRLYYSCKTVLERILSFLLLVLLFPIFAIVALAIKVTTPGPIFYSQNRLGYRGLPFNIWKFRSMRQDAEKQGHQWSMKGDQRITRFGSFLRNTRIDELPQLWNVIRGDMSLIGPRPERPEYYAELEKLIPMFPIRLLVRPGITGWAQVMGGYAATVAQNKRKLEYDLFYLQRMSPKMDLFIALRTLAIALRVGSRG